MAIRTPRRSEWHQVNGKWTRSLGHRGMRVRLFQKRKGGMFYRAVWMPGSGRSIASLGTADRVVAEDLGKRLLAALLDGEAPRANEPVRLGELWRRFQAECATFLDNAASTRADSRRRAEVLLAFWGPQRDVRTLTAHDVAQYSTTRRRGGVRLSRGRITPAVRQRSVQADLGLLRAMLRWAMTAPTPHGRWLERNPLDGVRLERERNPVRSWATYDRFLAVRDAVGKLRESAASETERTRWTRLELALVIAEATGRRRGAIAKLRWEDVDFERGTVHWRGEHDKTGMELVVPAPAALLNELRLFRRMLGAVGGPMFPSSKRRAESIRPEMLDQWLRAAETRAEVPKLRGGLWHPYRRKWATERKHLPLPDVMAAGGWRDALTVSNCYQRADETTMLEVMAAPMKLVSRRLEGSRGETAPETAPLAMLPPTKPNPASPK
jgi:integrase